MCGVCGWVGGWCVCMLMSCMYVCVGRWVACVGG